MARNDLLFELGIVGAMRHFNMRFTEVRQAMDIALVTRSKADIARLRGKIVVARLRNKVVKYERAYPMILRALVDGSHRKVGDRYGISHAWVGKIARAFSKLAAMGGMTEDALMRSVEREVRDV